MVPSFSSYTIILFHVASFIFTLLQHLQQLIRLFILTHKLLPSKLIDLLQVLYPSYSKIFHLAVERGLKDLGQAYDWKPEWFKLLYTVRSLCQPTILRIDSNFCITVVNESSIKDSIYFQIITDKRIARYMYFNSIWSFFTIYTNVVATWFIIVVCVM